MHVELELTQDLFIFRAAFEYRFNCFILSWLINTHPLCCYWFLLLL